MRGDACKWRDAAVTYSDGEGDRARPFRRLLAASRDGFTHVRASRDGGPRSEGEARERFPRRFGSEDRSYDRLIEEIITALPEFP